MKKTNMLPEHKLLIDFLNNRFEKSDLASLNPGNWSTFVSEAGRHRIAPLLYQKIKQANAESKIPEDVVRRLRATCLANAGRNIVLFHQLNDLVARLNSKSIPVILLKGAHLAEFVYKNIALRPMADIDILVKEEHLSETVRVAFDAGYCLMSDNIYEKEQNNKNYDYGIAPDVRHFETLNHPETNCFLEIHCSIASEASPFEISPPELWQNSQPAVLNKKSVFLLSPENLILHLCLHASHDDLFGYGLGALYDIAITIKYYDNRIDWEKLWQRSVQWRTNHCLCVSLYFIQKWFQVSLPQVMLEKFHIDKMVYIAEERIFRAAKIVDHHFIPKRIRRRIRKKIKQIQGVSSPSRDFVTSRNKKSEPSRFLFRSYLSGLYQALIEIFNIVRSALHREQFFYPLVRGDNDVLLRKWLTRSYE